MSTIRIAFLGTPPFARYHLEQLLQDEHFEVVGVVSQPDRPSGRKLQLTPSSVKQLALERGIPVLTPEKVSDQSVLNAIASWRAESAVVVAFGQILPQSFLDLYPRRVVNMHASLLPKWRGAAPIQRAIIAGDKVTGVSLQVMVKKLDAGDIIGRHSISIPDEWDALQLHDALMPLGARLLHIEYMDYLRGHLTPEPQDESQVTYAHKISNEEAELKWSVSAPDLLNHIRGLKMGPGTFTRWNGKVLKVHSAKVGEGSGAAGRVIAVSETSFIVACGKGALEILEVQPESRPKMAARDFLLGYKLKKGDEFK